MHCSLNKPEPFTPQQGDLELQREMSTVLDKVERNEKETGFLGGVGKSLGLCVLKPPQSPSTCPGQHWGTSQPVKFSSY